MKNQDWNDGLLKASLELCEIAGAKGQMDAEVLILDQETVGIVLDIDGVDYILSMQKLPKQRKRPSNN